MGIALVVVSLLFACSYYPLCEAKVGYCIEVTVNNSTMSSSWSRCQSTVPLSFNTETRITGTGNFSRRQSLDGFAKIGMKEALHGDQGKLTLSDLLSLSSRVDWIEINEVVENESRYLNINASDHYTIKINESIPTSLYIKQNLLYQGRGMYARNRYTNDDNNILTSYYGTQLLKSVVSLGMLAPRAYTFADVTPARATETVLEKRGVAFKLSSTSNRYSGFGVSSKDGFIEETYWGSFKLAKTVTSQLNYTYFDYSEDSGDYIPCCADASLYQAKYEDTALSADAIFNCTCFKVSP